MKFHVTRFDARPWLHEAVVKLSTLASALASAWIAARSHALSFDLSLLADKGNPSRAPEEVERLWQAAAKADAVAIAAQLVVTIFVYIAFPRRESGWKTRALLVIASLIVGAVLTLLMVLLAWTTESEIKVMTDRFIYRIAISQQ